MVMTAQPATSRTPRPSRGDTDDVVLARALEFSRWARTNIRLIVIGAVVLALVVGGLFYWRVNEANRRQEAAVAFLQLEQTAQAGNAALATRELEQFIRRYEGTTYAEEARIALAQLHLRANEPAKAVTVLQGAAGRVGDSPVGPQAALLLAAAQQAAGNRDAAIQTYLTVAEEAELDVFREDALQSAALLRNQAGDFAGAAELYRRLVESTEEGTVERQLFQMRLAEAEARAATR